MASVTDLTPYADRDAFPIMLTDGLRVRKTDDAYVVERLKSDLTWEALDVAGQATWGSIIGTLTDQSNVDTDDTLAADSDAKLATQKAVKAYVDASAGGGGSFLSANTARVDPSGDDGTGTVGDLNKPFLTVQAAITAIFALIGFDLSVTYVIDIGANDYSAEDLTIGNEISLMFKGSGQLPDKFLCGSLTLTDSAIIYLKDCSFGGGIITTSDDLDLVIDNADINSGIIVSTAGNTKHLNITSPSNSCYNVAEIRADDIGEINIIGLSADSGGGTIQVANSDATVRIKNCTFASTTTDDNGLFDLDFGGIATVLIINSVLGDVTLADGSAITLRDSRAGGSIDLGGGGTLITYEDVLLKSVPPGGTTGQLLKKTDETDFTTEWGDIV